MLVEEIPKSNVSSSTIYFSSSINLTARPWRKGGDSASGTSDEPANKPRPKVNYNVNQLMLAQTQANDVTTAASLKSNQQIQLERLVNKRIVELSSPSTSFDLPKNFHYKSIHTSHHRKSINSKLGNTPTTKKILSAKRNLNLYFEQERNLISVNTILNLNYQFIDFERSGEAKANSIIKPKLRLCCICGNVSNYTRCNLCGLFRCSVKCNTLHNELRCL